MKAQMLNNPVTISKTPHFLKIYSNDNWLNKTHKLIPC